ncbi:MAG: hypothetical protein H7319_02055 [Spirosoma sp.]|nr:hypothetical protein [Spirosoma sp.]
MFERDLAQHARNYETDLQHLANARPVLINCQIGKDCFTFDQNQYLFALAARISAETSDFVSTLHAAPKILTPIIYKAKLITEETR